MLIINTLKPVLFHPGTFATELVDNQLFPGYPRKYFKLNTKMSSSKKINVSYQLHQKIDAQCKVLKLTHKEYLEASVSFFLERQIDPRAYAPEADDHLIHQALERIFAFLTYQEKHLFKELHAEAARSRILSELSVNHLLSFLSEDEANFKKLQEQDQQYLSERLRQAVDKFASE